MTKYPSLDRVCSLPNRFVQSCLQPPLDISFLPQYPFSVFLFSRVSIHTVFRNENKHRRFSQAFHDSSRGRGSEERGENELERQTKAQISDGPGYTRDRARAFSPENPCSVSLFFKDAGTNPGRRSWWTDVGPPGANTNDGPTVTGTRCCIVSRESLFTENSLINDQVKRERQTERAADRP